MDAETSRHDAGTGQVLLGDGSGGFRALKPSEAGFSLYDEQRASGVADFDGDWRVDLVVGHQGGATRLLSNALGHPGVRVTVEGSPANRDGVGSVVRLVFGERRGAAREIHGGSGYLAQDSATLVLAAPTVPTAVEVRRPQGVLQRLNWPAGALEVVITHGGLIVH